MSSVKYSDKSIEEISALVENYKKNYFKIFDCDPPAEVLLKKIEELKAKKDQALFEQSFDTLTPKNLDHASKLISGKLAKGPFSLKKKG
jgi:hypothetical protein